VLALRVTEGSGSVTLSILREPYRWLGVGKRAMYTAYWTMLMQETGRQRLPPYFLPETDGELNTVARKMDICAIGNDRAMSISILEAGDRNARIHESHDITFSLELSKDLLGSARYCGVFWPSQAGWHQLYLKDKESGVVLDRQAVYVFGADDWLSHRRYQAQQASLHRMARKPLRQDQTEPGLTATPLGPFWPWLVLILSASLLWLERKLS
jgi:hypothetical protein